MAMPSSVFDRRPHWAVGTFRGRRFTVAWRDTRPAKFRLFVASRCGTSTLDARTIVTMRRSRGGRNENSRVLPFGAAAEPVASGSRTTVSPSRCSTRRHSPRAAFHAWLASRNPVRVPAIACLNSRSTPHPAGARGTRTARRGLQPAHRPALASQRRGRSRRLGRLGPRATRGRAARGSAVSKGREAVAPQGSVMYVGYAGRARSSSEGTDEPRIAWLSAHAVPRSLSGCPCAAPSGRQARYFSSSIPSLQPTLAARMTRSASIDHQRAAHYVPRRRRISTRLRAARIRRNNSSRRWLVT